MALARTVVSMVKVCEQGVGRRGKIQQKNENYAGHDRLKNEMKRTKAGFSFSFSLISPYLILGWGELESSLQAPFEGRFERRSNFIQDKTLWSRESYMPGL